VHGETTTSEEWPALFSGPRHLRDEQMDCSRLATLWRDECEDEYGTAAVIGTAAIALHLLGRAATTEEATRLASDMWHARQRARLAAA